MLYIGIDPGTKCGWAVIDGEGLHQAAGCWSIKARRHEGAGMRYVHFKSSLQQLLDAYPGAAVVVYEEVRHHAGTSAAHVYGGITATLQIVCEERELPYTAIPVGTVKKHATGKGNAGKPAMCATATARWGCGLWTADDNVADALWIADCYRATS